MPRFRLLRPLPEAVRFRNGDLTFRIYESMGGCGDTPEWRVYTERRTPHPLGTVLARAGTKPALENTLREGFDVETGSPAERVAEALVRLGAAEKLE